MLSRRALTASVVALTLSTGCLTPKEGKVTMGIGGTLILGAVVVSAVAPEPKNEDEGLSKATLVLPMIAAGLALVIAGAASAAKT